MPLLVTTKGATVNYEGICSGNEASLFECSNDDLENAACLSPLSSVGVTCEISKTDNAALIAG